MTSLTVMQIVKNLEIGGAQEVVRTLAENLEQAGCTSVVCAFRDGPLRAQIERLGIPVIILPERGNSVVAFPLFLRDMLMTRKKLRGLIEKYRVDVVQTHLLRSLDFLVLTLRVRGRPLIFWTIHNTMFDLRKDHLARYKWLLKPKRLAYHLLYRLGIRWADGFIAVSKDVKRSVLATMPGIPEEKVTIICNCVDVRHYRNKVNIPAVRSTLGLRKYDQVAAVVASFKEQKGHCYLLDAASLLIDRFPNLHFLFVGDGELRAPLQAQTRAMRLDQNIHYLGVRNDVPELLAACNFFVLPSLWEGLPMALIEAMASGLPAVASDVSGVRQVMIHGETGFLIPPGNSRALSKAMAVLLSDPGKAAQMGNAARLRIEKNFNAKKQAQEYIDLFERKSRGTNFIPEEASV
jgi:glycosyltransferase involved in cell wall biosynthesis